MKKKSLMTPKDILDVINEMFEEAIVVTDVGQHQMLVTSQFAGDDPEETAPYVRRTGDHGVWPSRSDWRQDRQSGQNR